MMLHRRSLAGLLLGAGAMQRAKAAEVMTIDRLYGTATADGLPLSDTARPLVGHSITLKGYMAPPLKAESDFFVLTRYPMSICPFCSSAADWPADIVMVKLSRSAETLSPSYAIEVTGTLDVGAQVDQDTGFVSLVRVVDARWRKV